VSLAAVRPEWDWIQELLWPVSPHAMRRWLERIEGLEFESRMEDVIAVANAGSSGFCDLADARRRILSPCVLLAVAMGQGVVRRDGYTIAVKNHVIVTILPGRHRFFSEAHA
jgi:hypothetical protein